MKSRGSIVLQSFSLHQRGSKCSQVNLSAAVSRVRGRVQERLRALAIGTPELEAYVNDRSNGDALLADALKAASPVAAHAPSHVGAAGGGMEFGERLLPGPPSDSPTVTLDQIIDIVVRCLVALIASAAPFEVAHDSAFGRTLTLTARQQAVLRLVSEGLSNKEIAQSLDITVPTVKRHLFWAMEKLGAENRTHAAILASRRQLL